MSVRLCPRRRVWRPPLYALLLIALCTSNVRSDEIQWRPLPTLPDAEGFAGGFAGVVRGKLLFAGGANFPEAPPWEGGTKFWYDDVYLLEEPGGAWQKVGALPGPRAYGVSITTPAGLLCVGGSDKTRHYADCFLLTYDQQRLHTEPMPSLPLPCANLSGTLLGSTVYVAGGTETPASTAALHKMWSLDLTKLEAGWREEPAWPGPARMLAVAAVQDGSFFLVSGAELAADNNGKPVRNYLRDAYRYAPGVGWNRIADLPRAAVAAPSPAPAVGQTHFCILGGDDGKLVDFEPKVEHPGFPDDVLAYHTITDTWTALGEIPRAVVTAPTAFWEGTGHVTVSGETRPAKRTPEVWSFKVLETREAFSPINYLVIAVYLAAMLGIGGWFAARQKSTADYFKAGGRIPWWAAGISIYATMLSSITFLSIPAKAYATDWKYLWQNIPILLLAPVIIYVYLPFFRQLDITTAYEYLERRFHPVLRFYGSTAFILFQIGRQAIVLFLPSLALATITDMSTHTCVLILGTLCVAYTALGGIEAVIWTDVIQTFVLLGAAILCLVLIIAGSDGGLAGFFEVANANEKFHMFEWKLDWKRTTDAFWVILGGNLFITLVPYTSDQTVVQRYLTTKDEKKAAQAIWTNALLAIPSTVFFFAIGTALWVYYRQHPDRLPPTVSTEGIFPSFIVHALPVGVAGLVIAGIFAAAQSTVSSSLNSVATAVVTDFYRRFRPAATDRRSLFIARVTTLLTGIMTTAAALFLASSDVRSLWDAYNTLVGLAGSGLAGLFLLGILTTRASAPGAVAGALASALGLYWVQTSTEVHFLLYAAIGIVTCVLVGYLVSFLLPHDRDLRGLTIYTRTRN